MNLSFLWWNTGLSPSGRNRSSDEELCFVKNLIKYLIDLAKFDFIALGEISKENLKEIEDVIGSHEISSGIVRAGRSNFSTCIIHNPKKINLLEYVSVVAEKGDRTYKVAQRASIQTLNDGTKIEIFISHWPSRLTLQKDNAERAFYGQKLREMVNDTDGRQCRDSKVILMGDYNDEPFDSSMTEHLMATRDRSLASRRQHLLYNPFWRKLGSEKPYSPRSTKENMFAGTCYYKSEQYSRWKTFDQMIFSSSFIGNSAWHLNEEKTSILSMPEIIEEVKSTTSNFDHLPVFGTIEQVY